ncbi:MAG: ABC transporter permease [Planctomycetales bacterium]|nr:ABC transporter permease [Planctomycetales bacterium]
MTGPRSTVHGPRSWSGGASLVVGLAFAGLSAALALAGPALAPEDPRAGDLARAYAAPSPGRPLGSDEQGRDLFSRTLSGARPSVGIALFGAAGALALGAPAGLLGAGRGLLAGAAMRGVDVLLAFPSLLFALAVLAVTGPGLGGVAATLAISGAPAAARAVHAAALSAAARAHVEAARALGVSPLGVALRHVAPLCAGPVAVWATQRIGQGLLAAAGLSFLGLGAPPGEPEWGAMLARGRDYAVTAPWLMLAPGLAITLTALGWNLLGDALAARLAARGGGG